MLTPIQKKITSSELQKNYTLLNQPESQTLKDLQFTPQRLHQALYVTSQTSGYDVWKLRDYLTDQLLLNDQHPHPYSVLTTNLYYPYQKTW